MWWRGSGCRRCGGEGVAVGGVVEREEVWRRGRRCGGEGGGVAEREEVWRGGSGWKGVAGMESEVIDRD